MTPFARTLSRFWDSPVRDSTALRCGDHYSCLECPSTYSKTSANPMALFAFSDFPALPLERDRLLDLLRGRVGPILQAPFHVSIRITSGTELIGVLRTQPRPVNAWAATEICWVGIEKRPFFHWHRHALRILAMRHFFISHLCGSLLSRIRGDSLYVFKIRRKKFTAAGSFPKESCGKRGASILEAGLSLSCRAGREPSFRRNQKRRTWAESNAPVM
jgi:hypothetical protein